MRKRIIVTKKELETEGIKLCIIDREGGTLLETWGLWWKD